MSMLALRVMKLELSMLAGLDGNISSARPGMSGGVSTLGLRLALASDANGQSCLAVNANRDRAVDRPTPGVHSVLWSGAD